MKKTILQSLLIIFVFTTACKNNTEQTPVQEELIEEISAPKNLTVNFSFKTDKSDTFRIMLNNIETDELQKKNIQIFEEVFPSSKSDAIIAKFDADNMSNNLVINLGNTNQKKVEIESIVITYGPNEIKATTPLQISEYFAMNKYVSFDSINNIITTKRVDNQHFPAISLKRKSINYLKKE